MKNSTNIEQLPRSGKSPKRRKSDISNNQTNTTQKRLKKEPNNVNPPAPAPKEQTPDQAHWTETEANESSPAPKTMAQAESYWDHYGNTGQSGYDEEIASSIDEDVSGTIKRFIKKEAKEIIIQMQQHELLTKMKTNPITVCDYGCGPGKWMKKLDAAFKQWETSTSIVGMDVSKNLVELAQAELLSARVEQADLEKVSDVQKVLRSKLVDFGVCANVLIAPELSSRRNILTSIRLTTKKGGIVIFVIPSLESALYTEWRWSHSGPTLLDPDDGEHIQSNNGNDAKNILSGCLERDGVQTKHYLKEEFAVVLRQFGFRVKNVGKSSYNWDMEFGEDVPEHLKSPGPGPWDWCFVAEKMV